MSILNSVLGNYLFGNIEVNKFCWLLTCERVFQSSSSYKVQLIRRMLLKRTIVLGILTTVIYCQIQRTYWLYKWYYTAFFIRNMLRKIL